MELFAPSYFTNRCSVGMENVRDKVESSLKKVTAVADMVVSSSEEAREVHLSAADVSWVPGVNYLAQLYTAYTVYQLEQTLSAGQIHEFGIKNEYKDRCLDVMVRVCILAVVYRNIGPRPLLKTAAVDMLMSVGTTFLGFDGIRGQVDLMQMFTDRRTSESIRLPWVGFRCTQAGGLEFAARLQALPVGDLATSDQDMSADEALAAGLRVKIDGLPLMSYVGVDSDTVFSLDEKKDLEAAGHRLWGDANISRSSDQIYSLMKETGLEPRYKQVMASLVQKMGPSNIGDLDIVGLVDCLNPSGQKFMEAMFRDFAGDVGDVVTHAQSMMTQALAQSDASDADARQISAVLAQAKDLLMNEFSDERLLGLINAANREGQSPAEAMARVVNHITGEFTGRALEQIITLCPPAYLNQLQQHLPQVIDLVYQVSSLVKERLDDSVFAPYKAAQEAVERAAPGPAGEELEDQPKTVVSADEEPHENEEQGLRGVKKTTHFDDGTSEEAIAAEIDSDYGKININRLTTSDNSRGSVRAIGSSIGGVVRGSASALQRRHADTQVLEASAHVTAGPVEMSGFFNGRRSGDDAKAVLNVNDMHSLVRAIGGTSSNDAGIRVKGPTGMVTLQGRVTTDERGETVAVLGHIAGETLEGQAQLVPEGGARPVLETSGSTVALHINEDGELAGLAARVAVFGHGIQFNNGDISLSGPLFDRFRAWSQGSLQPWRARVLDGVNPGDEGQTLMNALQGMDFSNGLFVGMLPALEDVPAATGMMEKVAEAAKRRGVSFEAGAENTSANIDFRPTSMSIGHTLTTLFNQYRKTGDKECLELLSLLQQAFFTSKLGSVMTVSCDGADVDVALPLHWTEDERARYRKVVHANGLDVTIHPKGHPMLKLFEGDEHE